MRKRLAVRIWINQFLKYLIIPIVFCLLLFPLYGLMHHQAETVQSAQVAESMTTAIASFENYLRTLQVTTIRLFNTDSFQHIAVRRGGMPEPAAANSAVNEFSSATYHLPYTGFAFVSFANNSLIADENRVYADCAAFYPRMLEYEGWSVEQWKSTFGGKTRVILPSRQVRINATAYPEKMLTIQQPYVTSSGTLRGTCHFLVRERDLVSLFLPEPEWRAQGIFYLVQPDEAPLMQYQCDSLPPVPYETLETSLEYNDQPYLFVSRRIEPLNAYAVAGLPASLYAESLKTLDITIATYICIGFLVCLLLSAGMTLLELRRMRPVLEALGGTKVKSENLLKEFVAQSINNYGSLSAELEQTRSALEASRISSLLRTGVIASQADRSALAQRMGLTKHNYLILLPKSVAEDLEDELTIMAVTQCVRSAYDRPPYVYTAMEGNILAVVSLESAQDEDLIRMCRQTEALYAQLELSEPLIVSDCFEGIDQISSAYWRVRNMAAYSDPTQKVCYLNEKSLVRNLTTDLASLERLSEYLMAGRTQEAQSLIDDFFRVDDLSQQNFRQAFYSVRGILLSAARAADCEDLAFLCADTGKSVYQQVQGLHDLCFEVCSRVDMLKRSHNEALQKNILAWLGEQYMRPDLSIAMTAERFHISQKYVSQFLKDQTGKSYTEYIEELRLTQAMKLLKTTDLGVTEIALKCGFSTQNTFYKAFRRRYGASPSSMRQTIQ